MNVKYSNTVFYVDFRQSLSWATKQSRTRLGTPLPDQRRFLSIIIFPVQDGWAS